MTMVNPVSFQVDPVRGFLPAQDPLGCLPGDFAIWDQTAAELPALLMTGRLRSTLERLPVLDTDRLEGDPQLLRAMVLLTALANAYVWAEGQAATHIPRAVAVPLWRASGRTGLPPIATHATTVLYNWRRLDKDGPIDLDNLAALQVFLGGMDEHWFYVTTVVIEAKGAPALGALLGAQQAVQADRVDDLARHFETIASTLADAYHVLERIPEKCDPHVFYYRVRPYLTGWPAPGVVYQGVSDVPRIYAGGSAAQSALIQALDAGLGIRHESAETNPFLMEMRRYMLPAHRRFVEALEAGASVRRFAEDRATAYPALADRYNDCILALDRFRKKHMELAVRYITHQAPNPEDAKGTGGTDFVSLLSRAGKETRGHKIDA